MTDAVKSYRSLQRRREILKDSHVGSFAVIGIVLLILAQFAAFASVPEGCGLRILILVPAVSRCCSARLDNTMMAASLYQYGLLMLETQANGKSKYVLSDFGKALKQNSLNFDDGIQGQVRLGSYNQLTPANLPSLATDEDIMKLFQ